MELPKPPQEIELRNIIDKLAQFVARNGPDFEQMTKNKQKGNPKFSFLFGGEHFNYYQYKVTTEQAILKQKSVRDHPLPQGSGVSTAMAPLVMNSQPQITTASSSSLDLAAAAVQWLAVTQQQPQAQPAQQAPLPQQANISVDNIIGQQSQLQDQIIQSEQNLTAQHSVLMQQQQSQIDDAVRKSQMDGLQRAADEVGISFLEFDAVLQPIIDSCTKDSISAGKGWILARSISPKINEILALYLLRKVINPSAHFIQKLHIIYLVNDVLHHCARKNAEDLKKALESVVVPMFCNASIGITEEQQVKLNKLLNLWESKNNYFDSSILEKMKHPAESWAEYQANLIAQHASVIAPITTNTKQTYDSYQAQHQAFVQHALQQIQTLEQQKQTLEQQAAAAQQAAEQQAAAQIAAAQAAAQQAAAQVVVQQVPPQQVTTVTVVPAAPANHAVPVESQVPMMQTSHIPPLLQTSHPSPPPQHHQQGMSLPPVSAHQNDLASPHVPPPQQIPPGLPHMSVMPQDIGQHNSPGIPPHGLPPHIPPGPPEINFSQPPPGYPPINFPPGLELPDLSKPPPGFPPPPPPLLQQNHLPPEFSLEELMPSVPYFELPAGLMVPLVRLEDSEYKPIDPESIRLPPPAPPSERLLAAVEAFYAPACHDRPRDRRILDSEGWEKLGLYEYYRAKNSARKQKEDEIAEGIRERSRSPSPILRTKSRSKTPVPKKRYRSKSRSRSRSHSRQRTKSRSRSPPRNFDNDGMNMNMNNKYDEFDIDGAPMYPESDERLYDRHEFPNRRSPQRRNFMRKQRSRSRSFSRSKSRSRSRSESRSRSKSRSRSRSYSRSRSRSPKRSPTPPSFMGSYSKTEFERHLDESNKGHQMLKKMGWSGAGLGVQEQGIEQPISSGEIRDKTDMYKGVGISLNDPYESFRKSKGQAFINRMKARAEERT